MFRISDYGFGSGYRKHIQSVTDSDMFGCRYIYFMKELYLDGRQVQDVNALYLNLYFYFYVNVAQPYPVVNELLSLSLSYLGIA